ncbi:TPA: hypothetical protein N0F65_006055 [Lagenidium giganteum]|uniref:EF-hand domain-containing protein n=1 Tax=Lagenidium giganteum TaxID=4803 RepID=A0AAV2YLN2_9STRA|nr:TPA: hypothetical protein N0F65_006055 [Lagenidium giganteum]
MQSTSNNFAPSMTPRPTKVGKGHSGVLVASNSRAGRSYTPVVPPGNAQPSFNPFAASTKVTGVVRNAETRTTTGGGGVLGGVVGSPTRALMLRKKQLILDGDIRNLSSGFDIGTSQVQLSLQHVVAVFDRYGVKVSNDEAKTLIHEYEENNDTNLPYDAFVEDLVQVLRQTALNKAGTSRVQVKKIRLTEHMSKLSTMHAHLVEEIEELLKLKLRVPWTVVRDAFRSADKEKRGIVSKEEFVAICASLNVPVGKTLVNGLAVRQEGRVVVDYSEFLTNFGSAFQHGDTNSVGFSLIYERGKRPSMEDTIPTDRTKHSPASTGVGKALIHDSPTKPVQGQPRPVNHASDPVYMEKLRIVLNEKISSRYSDVKKAFMALDKDGNGFISSEEFCQVLSNFNLVVTKEETMALMGYFDTNHDGSIDYHEFFAKFGDVMKPSAVAVKKTLENSSLVFSGSKDVKGANKNRSALSSPGNELKEAFSHMSDEVWRAIYVELDMSDAKKTGLVTSAELLRVLGKYMGDVAKNNFSVLFRACGSHVNQLMNFRTLVKCYRPDVMDPVHFFHQDVHALTEKTYRKSPTESLVMVWSIRVQRAQMLPNEWNALKEDIWKHDSRRQGRVLAAPFMNVVKQHMKLTEDQAAFLCYFYEDKNLSSDQVLIRYGSFLTDYEDPGVEPVDAPQPQLQKRSQRVEGKGRPRATGAPAADSKKHALAMENTEKLEREEEENRLKEFFRVNIRSFEALVLEEDSEKRGCVSVDALYGLCKELNGGKWKESKASNSFFAKYIAQNNFYYRGFLLDFDVKAGLQTQSLVIQEDADENNDGPTTTDGDDTVHSPEMDVYEAREAVRHHLTSSMSRQKMVYKYFQLMDPGKSGLLSHVEIRRVLERLDIIVGDDTLRELLSLYEEEEESTGAKTGRVKYLLFLHAHGGRDPDKLDGMSDLSSHCSYYSAITISPRSVLRPYEKERGNSTPRPLVSRDYTVAANAVANAIERGGRTGMMPLNNSAAAAIVEHKVKQLLEAAGKNKWKALVKAFQQVDSDHRGTVSPASLRKVLEEAGALLEQQELVRLQLKYDVEQNGRINYHEFLRNLTNSMSDLPSPNGNDDILGDASLPTIGSSPTKRSSKYNGPLASATQQVPDSVRQAVKAKWKAIYSSFKTLDKQGVGRVSSAHFKQLLEWYAIALNDESFLALLRQFDNREDGLVDYNKFMRACFG